MNPPSQSNQGTGEVLVSVWMITYNHGSYIRQALESVLMQVTDFSFEIVIGEDCSTDSTRDILIEYKARYPDLIRLVLHEKNIGMIENQNRTFSACRGRYIAMLEGDDYWLTPVKLKTQVDAMLRHPECDLSFHAAIDDRTGRVLSRYKQGNHKVPVEKFIAGGGYFCPTASLMLNRKIVQNLPVFLDDAPAGDYYIQILGAASGGGLYLDHIMCAYRLSSEGSWSQSIKQFEKKQDFRIRTEQKLEIMQEYMPARLKKSFVAKRFDLLLLIAFDYLIHGEKNQYCDYIGRAKSLKTQKNFYYWVVVSLHWAPWLLSYVHKSIRFLRNTYRYLLHSDIKKRLRLYNSY
jgi:glycosyltransferase involved in cell wall biosynthesis